MFNDLSSQSTGHQAVDDIFAETDKPNVGGIQSDVETHRVGLASTGENLSAIETEQPAAKRSYLKIIIIVTLAVAFLGGAYLVYSQFLNNNKNIDLNTVVESGENKTITTATSSGQKENDFVSGIPGVATTTISPIEITIPSNVATSSETAASSSVAEEEIPAVSTVDSDSDGLPDAEEKIAGTNINIIDTDNDGLSDYEEVKVYKTDPLSANTDGDDYLDGEEVKNGYNPCGDGKLPATSSLEELCAKY